MSDAHVRRRCTSRRRAAAAAAAVAAAVAAGLVLPGPLSSTPAVAAVPTLTVGHEILDRCGDAWCGRLSVPLEVALKGGPRISVAFRWYPARDGETDASGTVLPVEGGPGYPSIGSVAPAGYAAMYGPLLDRWNMLVVDLRGTGASTVVDCPSLQDFDGTDSGSTATARFDAVVAACAASLDDRWRAPGGGAIHASDLFTSAAAANDVADIVAALGVGPVDVYGDSYGSWFAQVFAARFPKLVRSVTLDSTYAVEHLDPWYVSTVLAMPADFDDACLRAAACAAAEPIPAWERVSQLAARLRASPVSGTVPGPSGGDVTVTMGVVGLVDLVSDAAEDPSIYAGLDAASRALLLDDDPAPLLRLYAQRLAVDEDYFDIPARDYSGGLYFAVSCLDYPQLFPMTAGPARRQADLVAREQALPATTFAPFTTAEWLAMDQYSEAYTACLDWPAPTIAEPPVGPRGLMLPARLPVLILGGEFDTWTPPSGIPQVRHEIGGDSRAVVLANSTHVVAEGETSGCAVSILRAFVADPSQIQHLDTSCAAAVPPIHAVGVYPSQLAQTPPLHAGPGSTTEPALLEAAAAMVDTAGDAVDRLQATFLSREAGLHGGDAAQHGRTVRLDAYQLVPGFAVSGSVTVGASQVAGTLHAIGPGQRRITLAVRWPPSGAGALAQVVGRAGRSALSGTVPAP